MRGASSTLERDSETASSGIERASTQNDNLAQSASPRMANKLVSGAPGCSIILVGDLRASEDVAVDGVIEGNIDLRGHNLTINVTGIVRGNICADTVVVHGTVRGNISASNQIELWRTGISVGDLIATRILIQDGAFLRGTIDIRRKEEIEESQSKLMAFQSEPIGERLNLRFHELIDKKLANKLTDKDYLELQEIERFMETSELKQMKDPNSVNLQLEMASKLAELIKELKTLSTSKPPK